VPPVIKSYKTAGAWTATIYSFGLSHAVGAHDYVEKSGYWKWGSKDHEAYVKRKGKSIRSVKWETMPGANSGSSTIVD